MVILCTYRKCDTYYHIHVMRFVTYLVPSLYCYLFGLLIEKRLGTSEVIHCKRHLKKEIEIFNTQGAGSVAFSLGR